MTSTFYKVYILVDRLWKVIVNDVAHIFDVQASGYCSGHNDRAGAPAEVERALEWGQHRMLMFSTTFPEGMQMLAREFLDNSIKILVGIPHAGPRETRSTVQRCTDRAQLRQCQWYCQHRLEQRCG
ncbi:hypothetical protein MRX96_026141 [Rhipicephalus microplus]